MWANSNNGKPKALFYILIVLLLLLLSGRVFIFPVMQDVIVLKRDIAVMNKENRAHEERLSNIRDIEREWEKWSGRLDESAGKVPPAGELNEVFGALEAVFAANPVDITGVSFGTTDNLAGEKQYAALNLDVSARGKAFNKNDDLIYFFAELERFPYLLIVENFTMHCGAETAGDGEDGNQKEILPRLDLALKIIFHREERPQS